MGSKVKVICVQLCGCYTGGGTRFDGVIKNQLFLATIHQIGMLVLCGKFKKKYMDCNVMKYHDMQQKYVELCPVCIFA